VRSLRLAAVPALVFGGGSCRQILGLDELTPDAAIADSPRADAAIDAVGMLCIGSNGYRVCYDATINVPSTMTLPADFDTDSNSSCEPNQPIGWMTPVEPAACVVVAQEIDVVMAGTRAHGSRPLVLAATVKISIAGLLDLSSRRSMTPGAGASDPSCVSGSPPTTGLLGGGAGGSFTKQGGGGGDGDNSLLTGGHAEGAIAPATKLHAGCAGQTGDSNPSGYGQGGAGGGAVLLVSNGMIVVMGAIDASGAGGGGASNLTGNSGFGGGGGGSGGMIVLVAPQLNLLGANIYADGGGGGGGADSSILGLSGADPVGAAACCAGGATKTAGGNGGHDLAAATPGTGGGSSAGGGGGGGAAGDIQIVGTNAGSAARLSPPAD
jgi:hypothetical protein